ncbi:MAG: class D sortase [Lachnospiraceae bacterium]|nr:class D sortase [Lachnospiraceae bacterium]
MKRKLLNLLGGLLISFGLLIVLGSVVLNIEQRAMQKEAINEFRQMVEDSRDVSLKEEPNKDEANEDVKTDAAADVSVKENDILYILRIPIIESESPVREGVSDGVLADSLGHEPGTAYIGETGNCVIAGHRNYSFGKFFNRLNEVEIGDNIYVDTKDATYKYEVYDIIVVEPDDLSVLDNTDEEIITLYTCTPVVIGTHRLVVKAKRVGE